MTGICGLLEMCKLTACHNDQSYAYDYQTNSHRDEDLPEDSLWHGNWDDEMQGDTQKKWDPKHDFCNLPPAFMCGINAHLNSPILLNVTHIIEYRRPTVGVTSGGAGNLDEDAWFEFTSPPGLAVLFVSGPFFEGASPAGRLQLAFREAATKN